MKEDLKDTLLGCKYIIWDITAYGAQIDLATWAVEMLRGEMEEFEAPKVFVCLSSVLTWAKTRPADPEDAEASLTEEEFKRRRAHNNFRGHIAAEKLVLKCGRKTNNKLHTYVIAAGLPYGNGEGVFHALFKAAWHADPAALPLFATGEGEAAGTNIVPTIHVKDLAGCILNVLESLPLTKYIVGIDESKSSLVDLTKCISENLGTSQIRRVLPELGAESLGMSQGDMDMLTVDLRIDSTAIKEMNVKWVAQAGMIEAIESVVTEYRLSRNLTPLRIAILGPPAVGKSYFSESVCKRYKLHHLHKQAVISDAVEKLKAAVAVLDTASEEVELTSEQQEAGDSAKETLETLSTQLTENGGRYEDAQVVAWFQERIKSMACRNQGYVLDGFPETEDKAKELFMNEEDPDTPDPNTAPEWVFALDASDTFLLNRAMSLPEAKITGTHYDETGMARRLALYSAANTDENTVLNYFDFNEIHPQHLEVANMADEEVMEAIVSAVGVPHNYGPTPTEQAAIAAAEAEAKERHDAEKAAEKAETDAREAADAAQNEADWAAKLAEVKAQESELLDTSAAPLRNFLVRHVMPSLTEGLVEVCKAKPKDPVDFLAEYLFKHNPQIE